jgi:ribosomal protein L34
MSKHTLSNKGRHSILKLSGFRARMATPKVVKLSKQTKKGRKTLAIRR